MLIYNFDSYYSLILVMTVNMYQEIKSCLNTVNFFFNFPEGTRTEITLN